MSHSPARVTQWLGVYTACQWRYCLLPSGEPRLQLGNAVHHQEGAHCQGQANTHTSNYSILPRKWWVNNLTCTKS